MVRIVARDRRHARCSDLVAWGLLVLAFLAPAAPGFGFWLRLSQGPPFSNVISGPVQGPLLTDRWALFVHDPDVDDAHELWRVQSFGGVQQRISGLLPGLAFVRQIDIDPAGNRAVYLAPEDTFNVDELYSVPIAGGPAVKLNPSLPAGRDVQTFRISPDGQRVVYLALQDSATVAELYSVPITGGSAIKISGTLVAGGAVDGFQISGDSARVVFSGDRLTDGVREVFSVPIAGGAIGRLNDPPAGNNVGAFVIAPNSQRVVYFGDQDTPGISELYSVPIGGGGNVKLSGAMTPGGMVRQMPVISPDSQRVIYLADQVTLNVYELFGTAMTGGGAVKLNGALVPGGNVDFIHFGFSPDSQRVVYVADQQTLGVFELYSVLPTGGGAVKLNGTLVSGGDVLDFLFSPSSQWVVYRADQTLNGLPLGIRVPVAGPAASGQFVWQGPVTQSAEDVRIAPDGRSIVVRGNGAFIDGIVRLWRFPLEGTLNPTGSELVPAADFQPEGDVQAFTIGANGGILYVADQLTDAMPELFTVPVAVFWDGFDSGTTSAWSSSVP